MKSGNFEKRTPKSTSASCDIGVARNRIVLDRIHHVEVPYNIHSSLDTSSLFRVTIPKMCVANINT